MSTQSTIDHFQKTHGAQWAATSEDLCDEYSAGYLASGIQRQLKAVFETTGIRTRVPDLTVEVVVLPQAVTRCFIWRNPHASHDYVLALHIGTFASISALMSAPALWKSIIPKLTFLGRLHPPDFHRLASQMVINALSYHEVAHIVRGHAGYVAAAANADDRRMRKQLCEVDADKWSSFLLGGDLSSHADGISRSMTGTNHVAELISLELLQVLGAGLYRCFAVYNQLGLPKSSLYPHPLLRAMNVAIGTADNFKRGPQGWPEVQKNLVSVLKGLSSAEALSSQCAELPQTSWDLGKELLAFEQAYGQRLKELDAELSPHCPAHGSTPH